MLSPSSRHDTRLHQEGDPAPEARLTPNIEQTPAAGAADTLVRFENVSKYYGRDSKSVHVVDNVSFTARRSEFISILGPSGCGKSTMMMLTSGLIPASSGAISINGEVIDKPYTNLGIVFQQDLLMDWRRVLSNVLVQPEFRGLPAKDYEQRARDLLKLVGLAGSENKYPYELSGGMRQRVAICRALVHNPELLLMDEPFGALDALTRDQMNLDLQRIWFENKKTVLFVTHSIPEAVFLGDRIFIMAPSPTKILEEIEVDLPRPRTLEIRETSEFAAYVHRVTQIFYKMGILRS
jgi:NitT/TauT family transport system ATP-binding protein